MSPAGPPQTTTDRPTSGHVYKRMGVEPRLFALVMSPAAPTSNNHADRQVATHPSLVHGSVAHIVCPGDVSGRPASTNHWHTDGVATLASHVHGSVAIIVRLGDVSGRAHLEQPLADHQVATMASTVHGVLSIVRLVDVSGRAHLEQPLADRRVTTAQALCMGVSPLLFVLVMSPAPAPTTTGRPTGGHLQAKCMGSTLIGAWECSSHTGF